VWLLGAEDVKANAGRLDPQVDHLWAQIMHLRYRRAGCHARAWSEAELTTHEIISLSFVCHSETLINVELIRSSLPWPDDLPTALARLRDLKWIEEAKGGWQGMTGGREARATIEARTNALDGRPYMTLSRDGRVVFLEAMSGLPGED